MAGFSIYKKKEWWREEGETPDYARKISESKEKKDEEYDLKRGSDGRNKPSIVNSYAGGKVKKSKKFVAKTITEAFGDEEENFDTDEGYEVDDQIEDEGINDEADLPVDDEMEDEDMGSSVCTCPACGAKLVIETVDEEEAEGEEGFEDEDMENDEIDNEDMGMESEDKDMSVPKFEKKQDKYNKYAKKVESKKNTVNEEEEFEKAYQEWKKERMKRIEALKNRKNRKSEAESEIGVEYGSDTSDMVKKGQTSSGTKTDVGDGNDDDPGITSSETSDMVKSGQTSSGVKTVQSEKKVTKKRTIDEEEQAAVTDPFEDKDDADAVTTDDFANLPVDVGADPDAITKYQNVQERRKARKANPDAQKQVNESFDFKKLVRGEYSK